MKLICINCWGGKQREALHAYMQAHASSTDIFCLQEVFSSPVPVLEKEGMDFQLLQHLESAFPDFQMWYAPMVTARVLSHVEGVTSGNVIMIKRGIEVSSHGFSYLHGVMKEYPLHAGHDIGFMQYAEIMHEGKTHTIINVHGIASWPKEDSVERDAQLHVLMQYITQRTQPIILCGDFNLFPHTRSIQELSNALCNLGAQYGISTTRSDLHYDIFGRGPAVDRISDYMFVSPVVEVRHFSVPSAQVSDHLPLELDYSI
jgi:endonuclease/exonuclease/phosphatase family metal-dependent hydrolase